MPSPKNKHIDFTKAATTAFHSLNDKEKKKAIYLIELISNDFHSAELQNKFYKLSNPQRKLYAIKLTLKLRIIIEILDDVVKVLDILNHDLFIKYFSKSI